MPGIEHRSAIPLTQMIRVFLRGREIKLSLRYADSLAARTQPPPQIPDGPNHKLSKVYYYMRDVRYDVTPPEQVVSQKKITEGAGQSSEIKMVQPGKVYKWD